eukprot:gene30398-37607_t
MSSTYGKIFKISTFGESHGRAIGVVVDGCPSGVVFDEMFVQNELDRRKPDYTYSTKYGVRDYRGGGRSSARETAARVAAGALAKMVLNHYGIEIYSYVSQVGAM